MSNSIFQQEQDRIIASIDEGKRLLLHSCCGPCSTYCLEVLARYFSVTLLWYNPNIFPVQEYYKRLETQKQVIEKLKTKYPVNIEILEYEEQEYLRAAAGLESQPEGGLRCTECFKLRLKKTAEYAKKNGFDFFTTTLTVSPHKNAPLINEIGKQFEEIYGVKFLPSDFKKKNGYKRSTELSKQLGLYRQNYCGCRFSLREE